MLLLLLLMLVLLVMEWELEGWVPCCSCYIPREPMFLSLQRSVLSLIKLTSALPRSLVREARQESRAERDVRESCLQCVTDGRSMKESLSSLRLRMISQITTNLIGSKATPGRRECCRSIPRHRFPGFPGIKDHSALTKRTSTYTLVPREGLVFPTCPKRGGGHRHGPSSLGYRH